MASNNSLKVIFLNTFLIVCANSGMAGAESPSFLHDTEGFRMEPSCDEFSTMKDMLVENSELPSGKKASNDKWDMEIYENKATGLWSLLSRNKNPASEYEESCILKSGYDTSYTQEKWYKKYFQQTP